MSARIDIRSDVIALSIARLGDAIGNSLLFVVIPLYVARMPAPWFPLSETERIGILISAYPQSRLPYLATYLGHRDIYSTLAYLNTTPELLLLASKRFLAYVPRSIADAGRLP